MSDFIHKHGARALVRHADDASVDELREAAREAARSPGEPHLIAAYDRAGLGQTGAGHFSPLGGYHEGAISRCSSTATALGCALEGRASRVEPLALLLLALPGRFFAALPAPLRARVDAMRDPASLPEIVRGEVERLRRQMRALEEG